MKFKIMAVMTVFLLISAGLFASKGTSAAPFLKLGFGARAAGLGQAYSALATDATGEYWNIGAVAFANESQLAFMHNNIYQDVTHNYLSYIHKISESSFITGGISYISMDKFDKIRMTSFYTPEIVGTFNSTNSVVSVGYSKRVDWFADVPFSAGINLKSIMSKIDVHSASALAVDFGTLAELNENIYMALTIKNLGTKMKYVSKSEDLPLKYSLGFSINLEESLIFAMDINFSPVDRETFSFGSEYTFNNLFSVRAGYNSENDLETGITNFGMGLKINNIKFDYAYLLYGALGNSHNLSINLNI